jgi:hypothetical protein
LLFDVFASQITGGLTSEALGVAGKVIAGTRLERALARLDVAVQVFLKEESGVLALNAEARQALINARNLKELEIIAQRYSGELGPLAERVKELQKELRINVPESIEALQKQQAAIVAGQQAALREAIEDFGAQGKGIHFEQLGADIERLQTKVVTEAAPKASIELNPGVAPRAKGPGRFLDVLVEKGNIKVLVETKFSLPLSGEGLTRVQKQLSRGGRLLGENDRLILNVAKPPTPAEIAKFRSLLPANVRNKVRIVSNLEDLYTAVKAAFQ